MTIFVPTLPENSFSADLWDVSSQVPCIAYLNKEEAIKMIYVNDTCALYPSDLVPGFPVLVVKTNERLLPESDIKGEGKIYTKGGNTRKLRFIDDYFDNISRESQGKSTLECYNIETRFTRPVEDEYIPATEEDLKYLSSFEKRLYDAFKVFDGNNLGWQRDNLYYSLSLEKSKGPFNYDMSECLIGFEFVSNGSASIDKISDKGDPQHPAIGSIAKRIDMYNLWSEGDFEFLVKVYYASKTGAGTEKTTFFVADPRELFSMEWTQVNSDPVANYRLTDIVPKRIDLNLPLFDWNLDNYSTTIKIALEEVDDGTSYNSSVSNTVEFATNFSFDASYGDKVKVGFKYGTSVKESTTVSYTQTVKDDNDALGEVIVNFADDVITSDKIVKQKFIRPGAVPKVKLKDYNNKYFTGWYRIYLAPKKMN